MNKRNWLQTTNARGGNMKSEILFSAKVAAYRGEGRRTNHFLVDIVDREVRVWDEVSRSYTLCHSIAPTTLARLLTTADVLSEGL